MNDKSTTPARNPRRASRDPKKPRERAPSNAKVQMDNPHKRRQASRQQIVQLKHSAKEVALFRHLSQFEKPTSVSLMMKNRDAIHPAFMT